MFARFDENPAMTLPDIKETKRYGRTDGHTDARTHGRTDNVKTVCPPQTKFAGGIINSSLSPVALNVVSSKAVLMLFLIHCLLLLPLFCGVLVFNLCFVVHYSVSFLGFQ